MADFEADSVRGPKEIWNPISPGYSDVLGIVGSRETTENMFGGDMDGPGGDASLKLLTC